MISSTEKKAHVRRSRAQRERLIAEQASSELGQGAFCAAHGLAPSSFRNWKRKLELDTNTAGSSPSAGFVELAPRPAPAATVWDIELELGDGVVLRVRRG